MRVRIAQDILPVQSEQKSLHKHLKLKRGFDSSQQQFLGPKVELMTRNYFPGIEIDPIRELITEVGIENRLVASRTDIATCSKAHVLERFPKVQSLGRDFSVWSI